MAAAFNWNSDFGKRLLESETSVDFLKPFITTTGPESLTDGPTPLSYAQFARRAGYASRGFVRDLVLGVKPLTASSFEKVARGLQLNRDAKELLRYLIALEDPTVLERPLTRNNVLLKLQSIKERLFKKVEVSAWSSDRAQSVGSQMLFHPDVTSVYAASGTLEHGASFSDIAARCKLPDDRVREALSILLASQVLSEKNDRYFPCEGHIALERLGGNEFFKIDFERSLQLARQRSKAAQTKSATDALFFSSTFSVTQKNLPIFRERLSALMLEFVNEAENSNGDTVADLVVGFSTPAE